MTDTVTVPREVLELFDRVMRDADVSFYHPARQTLHKLLAAAPKAEPVSDPYKLEPLLWSMHILGPDDVYPAPDLATAFKWCEYVNSQLTPRTPDVLCAAIPAPWDGTAEEHANSLQDAIKGWTLPPQPLSNPQQLEAPKGEPVAWVPVHPRNGYLWSESGPDARAKENLKSYPFEAIYTHPAPSSELLEALDDLTSWFTEPVQGLNGPVWAVPAGDRGATDAIEVARHLIAQHKGPQS